MMNAEFWGMFLQALLATWILSAIIFMVGERMFESKPQSMRHRVSQTLLWPIPAALMMLLMVLGTIMEFLELLLEPWLDYGADDDEDDTPDGDAP